MPSRTLKFLNRGFWLFLVTCAGLNLAAATLFAGLLGRIDVLALMIGLLLATFVAWYFVRSRKERGLRIAAPASAPNFGYYQAGMTMPVGVNSADRRLIPPVPAYATATATRPAISRKSLDDDTKPRKDDTRPKRPAQVAQAVG